MLLVDYHLGNFWNSVFQIMQQRAGLLVVVIFFTETVSGSMGMLFTVKPLLRINFPHWDCNALTYLMSVCFSLINYLISYNVCRQTETRCISKIITSVGRVSLLMFKLVSVSKYAISNRQFHIK